MVKRDAATEPTYYQMKRERLAKDGRLDELNRRVQERLEAEGIDRSEGNRGLQLSKIYREVMDSMLPDGDETVTEWYRDQVLELDRVRQEQKELAELEEARREKFKSDFQEVFVGLADSASPADVMSWIENHPAMNLEPDGYELVADDIRTAPCRAAVGNLRHWLEHKQEFYKNWMQRAKAGGLSGSAEVSESVEEDVIADPKTDEIERMLRDMESQATGR